MSLLSPSPPGKRGPNLGAMSLLLAVPAILIAAPGVGFFIGQWADKRCGTDPYLTIAGLILGFIAAGREIYRLVQKAQAIDKQDDKKD